MNKNSKRTCIYLLIMLLSVSASVTLRSVAYLMHFDYSTGFFTDRMLINTADAVIWISVIIMLTYFIGAQKTALKPSYSTPATYVPTGIFGAAVIFLGMRTLTTAIGNSTSIASQVKFIAIITAVLSFVSAVHCFFNTFITQGHTELRAYFSLGTVAFLALYSIFIYFDSSLPMNEPAKIVNLMAFLFSAIFFLYETRISLGREMWRTYTAFGLIASALTAYSSIPAIVIYYTNGALIPEAVKGTSITSIEEYMVLLSLFIYILSRTLLTVSLREKKENALINAMAEYAQIKDSRVSESFERHQEIFASRQLSFFDILENEEEPQAENEATEESAEEKEDAPIMLSDDVIYESIFGKMPEKPRPVLNISEKSEEDVTDDREPEEIANDILNQLDSFNAESENDSDENGNDNESEVIENSQSKSDEDTQDESTKKGEKDINDNDKNERESNEEDTGN